MFSIAAVVLSTDLEEDIPDTNLRVVPRLLPIGTPPIPPYRYA